MSVKRKDKKGRILKDGESQRKNGQYEYKYIDTDGGRKSVYSWRLVSSDVTPPGKKVDMPLRDKENEIRKKLDDKLIVSAKKTTLNQLFKIHMEIVKLSNATRENYQYMWKKFVQNTLGVRNVQTLKKSDILIFYSDMKKRGLADGTIQIFHKMIHPSLQLAVEDHIIRDNPSDKCCREYSGKDAVEKAALTVEEVEIFMRELRKYDWRQDYEPLFRIMLGLACRRGEIIGLTWNDVNMKDRTVTIDHSVLYKYKDGKRVFYAKTTKTNNARVIPMTQEVYKCFKMLQKSRLQHVSTAEVDGYRDFVFTATNGKTPLYPDNLNIIIRKVMTRYNANADVPLPSISTHTFRHTGCTRMVEAGIDIKTICYIMGHNSYEMVLTVYDHVNLERAKNQMHKVDELIRNSM